MTFLLYKGVFVRRPDCGVIVFVNDLCFCWEIKLILECLC